MQELKQNILHPSSPVRAKECLDQLIEVTKRDTAYIIRQRWLGRVVIITLIGLLTLAASLVCYHMKGVDLLVRGEVTGRAYCVAFAISGFATFVASLMRR